MCSSPARFNRLDEARPPGALFPVSKMTAGMPFRFNAQPHASPAKPPPTTATGKPWSGNPGSELLQAAPAVLWEAPFEPLGAPAPTGPVLAAGTALQRPLPCGMTGTVDTVLYNLCKCTGWRNREEGGCTPLTCIGSK
mmetsp:Transcript_74609/g.177598  ORF Transcript_74609/g.177598 Transcript_74609/m.177598 type:complete len:138 (+) Transcript_74609:786-1199(+)